MKNAKNTFYSKVFFSFVNKVKHVKNNFSQKHQILYQDLIAKQRNKNIFKNDKNKKNADTY